MNPGDDIARTVTLHVQIHAHRWGERHGFEQRAEIAEGIVQQRIVVGAQCLAVVLQRADVGHNHDFAQCERDPLAQLVGCRYGLLPPSVEHRIAKEGRRRVNIAVGEQQWQMMRGRPGELVVQPIGVADGLHGRDVSRTRPLAVPESSVQAGGAAGGVKVCLP